MTQYAIGPRTRLFWIGSITPSGSFSTVLIPGGGGDLPYGSAALPTGMSWNYTEGGTRIVTGSPLSFSHSSVPAVTGTTRDANSSASFASALAASVDGDGIRITADFSVSSPVTLPNRSSSGGWVVIFTDRKASLDSAVPYDSDYITCTSASRLENADTTLYRTITTTQSGAGAAITCTSGTAGYWIVGVKFTRTNNANDTIVDFGASGISLESNLPNRLVLDRCVIDAAEKSKRCMTVNGKDILVSGSTIINAVSTPQGYSDSQAIAAWAAGKNVLIFNNACSAESEIIAFGGDSPQVTNLQPGTNVAVIRNHLFKPSACDSDVSYALKKNMFEHKTGSKCLWFGNVCDHYRSSSGGQFYQMMFTPTNQNNDASWQGIFDLNVVGNYFINGTEGGILTISAQGSSSNPNAGGARWTFAQNYQKHGSGDGQSRIQILGSATGQHSIANCHIEHNTFHCDEMWFVIENALSGVGNWTNFVCRNNANARSASFGPIFTSTTLNAAALDDQLGIGNWTFAKNAQVSGGASWGATLLGSPHNNLQDTAANMFTNPGTSDYSAKVSGPLDNAATDGFDIGVDTNWIENTLTVGVQ